MAYVKRNYAIVNVKMRSIGDSDYLLGLVDYDLFDDSTDPDQQVAAGRETVVISTATEAEIAAVISVSAKAVALLG